MNDEECIVDSDERASKRTKGGTPEEVSGRESEGSKVGEQERVGESSVRLVKQYIYGYPVSFLGVDVSQLASSARHRRRWSAPLLGRRFPNATLRAHAPLPSLAQQV